MDMLGMEDVGDGTARCLLTLNLKATAAAHAAVAWYPARRKSAWCTLMRFRLIKNGVAHVYDVHTV